jgi:hypothetical protein
MKRAILVLVILAAAAIVIVKLTSPTQPPQPQPTAVTTSSAAAQNKLIFYLFHDPSDQDAGCRRIYSYADRAERELIGKVEVRRPDVKREKKLIQQYQVRVLPTNLLVSASGAVQERFEGEDDATAERIEQALERLKGMPQ